MTLRTSSFKKIDSDIMTNSIPSHSPRNNGRKNSINLKNCEPVRVMLETTASFKNLAQDVKNSESDYLGVKTNGYGSKFPHKPMPQNSLPEPAVLFSPRPISELDAAAVKLQKVYKSYRTRRNLADCALFTKVYKSWLLATAQPFSPLYHRAALQQGTSQILESPQVASNSEQGNERKGVVKMEKEEEERKYKLGMSRLGSRPPNCDHRCGHCRPCIAIQVPANTQRLQPQFANYEPEGWKCKCGSSFFTP